MLHNEILRRFHTGGGEGESVELLPHKGTKRPLPAPLCHNNQVMREEPLQSRRVQAKEKANEANGECTGSRRSSEERRHKRERNADDDKEVTRSDNDFFESLPSASLLVNPTTFSVTRCNKSAVEMLGYSTQSELAGYNITSLFSSSKELFRAPPLHVGQWNSPEPVTAKRRDGSHVNLLVTFGTWPRGELLVNCILNKSVRRDQVKNLASANFALAALKGQNIELEGDKAILEDSVKAEKWKNSFLAHEVRNPLSVAHSAADFLKDFIKLHCGNFQDEQARTSAEEDVELIRNSLTFINDVVSSMLDLEMVNSGNIQLQETSHLLGRDILEPVKNMLNLNQSSVTITTECEENLSILADGLRVKQIVLNLAKNALKFTEKGFVTIRGGLSHSNECVFIHVEDSGPGFPSSLKQALFSKYMKAGCGGMDSRSGLGLSLCWALVQSMNGTITLDESYSSGIPGSPGSRFVVSLPLALSNKPHHERVISDQQNALVVPESVSDPESTEDLKRRSRFLFIDDNSVIRKLFVRRMKKLLPHVIVDEAPSGEEALVILQKFSDYSIIFVDHELSGSLNPLQHGPALNGEETIQKIRAMGVRSVVIGVSGSNVAEMHFKAGADLFFMKPLPNNGDLLPILARMMEKYYTIPQ